MLYCMSPGNAAALDPSEGYVCSGRTHPTYCSYEMKGWRRGKQDEEMRKKTKINYIQTSSANKEPQVLLAQINVVITAAQCFGSTGLSTRDFKHVFVMMQLCVCFRCLGENKSQNPP